MRAVELPPEADAHQITGLLPGSLGLVATFLLKDRPDRPAVFVAGNSSQAVSWEQSFRLFSEDPADSILYLPGLLESDADEKRRFENACDRFQVLNHLARAGKTGKPFRLFTTLSALLESVPESDRLRAESCYLRVGEELSMKGLAERLAAEFGYSNEVVCEAPGQFAVRGGLLDVYPMQAGEPYRIDFFGDEIESIRTFDPTTQRTQQSVLGIDILSAGLLDEAKGSLASYRSSNWDWYLMGVSEMRQHRSEVFQVPEKIEASQPSFSPWWEGDTGREDRWTDLSWLDQFPVGFPKRTEILSFGSTGLDTWLPQDSSYGDSFINPESEETERKRFLGQVLEWQKKGAVVQFIFRHDGERERIEALLADDRELSELRPEWIHGSLEAGFFLESDPLAPWGDQPIVVATASEMLGHFRSPTARSQNRKLARHGQVEHLLNFAELEEGSPVVHLAHGICLYRGLRTLQGKEVLTVEFAEAALLHVPLHESHLLSRYVGLSKSHPKLAKLGSGNWEKLRRQAEESTLDYASRLLRLQAERESNPGFSFSPDHPWQERFERNFPYRETPDQLVAIRQTKADMELTRPMDRLICGDVGFGKTEIALRAAFKAVMDGKQVAVLVPTTVLCQQHFNQFRERMETFPLTVEMLSRFRKPKEQKIIKERLASGAVDVVVGTHSLLAANIKFRDLGLLIVDEEHRFGVKHKEALKEIKRGVDVITLSATPIPRTLYLALAGARDLSVMETPPVDRRPIETYVKTYNEDLIRKAIAFELERGGQVFYLHNRVATIHKVAAMLEKMFPDHNIGIGHGQMKENDLERVMTDFVAGRYSVLVCTTIIESGLDIPNCNTLIIEGADRFGLAQLYQIRGRVGRFRRQAYAYLLLHKHASLLDPARKRLDAIRQYSQLGAGYRIAMRDLELRGAGNLLGAEQSGMIAGIGFELYCQLLQQSIARLKGDKSAQLVRATLRLDFVKQGEAHNEEGEASQGADTPTGYRALKAAQKEESGPQLVAVIPTSYIPEPRLRIDLYRKLAMAALEGELDRIEEDLQDRFGSPPQTVVTLLGLTRIRILAQDRGIGVVETEGNVLKCKRATPHNDPYIKTGSRFPRLTAKSVSKRLKEIMDFLRRLPPHS